MAFGHFLLGSHNFMVTTHSWLVCEVGLSFYLMHFVNRSTILVLFCIWVAYFAHCGCLWMQLHNYFVFLIIFGH